MYLGHIDHPYKYCNNSKFLTGIDFLELVQVFQLAPYAGQGETCIGVETPFVVVDMPIFIHKKLD